MAAEIGRNEGPDKRCGAPLQLAWSSERRTERERERQTDRQTERRAQADIDRTTPSIIHCDKHVEAQRIRNESRRECGRSTRISRGDETRSGNHGSFASTWRWQHIFPLTLVSLVGVRGAEVVTDTENGLQASDGSLLSLANMLAPPTRTHEPRSIRPYSNSWRKVPTRTCRYTFS